MRKKSAIAFLIISIVAFIMSGCGTQKTDEQKQNDIDTSLSSGEMVLKSKCVDDLKGISSQYGVEIEKDGNTYYLHNIDLFGASYHCIANADTDGNLQEVDCYRMINGVFNQATGQYIYQKMSMEEVKGASLDIVQRFSAFFGVVDGEKYYTIFNEDGSSIDQGLGEPFEKVLDGSAYLELTVKEDIGSFWKLTIKKSSETELECWISHYIGDAEYDNFYGNINLSE